nr:gibberellin-regulated protein 9-like [Ipomoea batatas]
MKIFSIFFISILLIQGFGEALLMDDFNNSVTQIVGMHAQEDVGNHQERMCAVEHVRRAAGDATVSHRELTATSIFALAMPALRLMETSSSAHNSL